MKKEKERKAKYVLFAAAMQEKYSTPLAYQPRPTRIGPNPPGPCFRCTQTGYICPDIPAQTVLPRPPATHQTLLHMQTVGPLENGWSSDTTHQISGSTPGPTTMGGNQTRGGPGTPDHGSSDEVRDDPVVPELLQ